MSFIFNEISSDDMGLFVEKYPPRPFPTRKADVYQIPGRSGDLVVDQNAFSNIVQEYEVFVKGGTEGFQARATAIARWLLGASGYQQLRDEYDPTIYREARYVGGVSFLNALNKYGQATLTFDCKPQRFPIDEEIITGLIGQTFTLPTVTDAMPGYPLLTITDTIVDVSYKIEVPALNLTITVPGQSAARPAIYIDFETGVISGRPSNPTAVSVAGKFGAIGNGAQIVTTLETGETAPRIGITPNRWFL